VTMAKPMYPFLPRSNARLEPGQFFSFCLANGRFACVRVLAKCWKHQPGHRVLFLAGLMNWSGDRPASSVDLADCAVLDYAWAHVCVFPLYGASIDGIRPLEGDRIVADTDCSRAYGPEVLRNLANERFAGVLTTDSSTTAFEYRRVGWKIIKEVEFPNGERKYHLEWQRDSPPASVDWDQRYWRFK
jgi:hypothetical protein